MTAHIPGTGHIHHTNPNSHLSHEASIALWLCAPVESGPVVNRREIVGVVLCTKVIVPYLVVDTPKLFLRVMSGRVEPLRSAPFLSLPLELAVLGGKVLRIGNSRTSKSYNEDKLVILGRNTPSW